MSQGYHWYDLYNSNLLNNNNPNNGTNMPPNDGTNMPRNDSNGGSAQPSFNNNSNNNNNVSSTYNPASSSPGQPGYEQNSFGGGYRSDQHMEGTFGQNTPYRQGPGFGTNSNQQLSLSMEMMMQKMQRLEQEVQQLRNAQQPLLGAQPLVQQQQVPPQQQSAAQHTPVGGLPPAQQDQQHQMMPQQNRHALASGIGTPLAQSTVVAPAPQALKKAKPKRPETPPPITISTRTPLPLLSTPFLAASTAAAGSGGINTASVHTTNVASAVALHQPANAGAISTGHDAGQAQEPAPPAPSEKPTPPAPWATSGQQNIPPGATVQQAQQSDQAQKDAEAKAEADAKGAQLASRSTFDIADFAANIEPHKSGMLGRVTHTLRTDTENKARMKVDMNKFSNQETFMAAMDKAVAKAYAIWRKDNHLTHICVKCRVHNLDCDGDVPCKNCRDDGAVCHVMHCNGEAPHCPRTRNQDCIGLHDDWCAMIMDAVMESHPEVDPKYRDEISKAFFDLHLIPSTTTARSL